MELAELYKFFFSMIHESRGHPINLVRRFFWAEKKLSVHYFVKFEPAIENTQFDHGVIKLEARLDLNSEPEESKAPVVTSVEKPVKFLPLVKIVLRDSDNTIWMDKSHISILCGFFNTYDVDDVVGEFVKQAKSGLRRTLKTPEEALADDWWGRSD